MADYNDGEVDVPLPKPCPPDKETIVDEQDYAQLKLHCHNGAQEAANSARLFAETLRLDHLEQRRVIDQQESVAARNYHASGSGPDAS